MTAPNTIKSPNSWLKVCCQCPPEVRIIWAEQLQQCGHKMFSSDFSGFWIQINVIMTVPEVQISFLFIVVSRLCRDDWWRPVQVWLTDWFTDWSCPGLNIWIYRDTSGLFNWFRLYNFLYWLVKIMILLYIILYCPARTRLSAPLPSLYKLAGAPPWGCRFSKLDKGMTIDLNLVNIWFLLLIRQSRGSQSVRGVETSGFSTW